uniref:Pentacotripeptide-repeat region of PRORP domain-containing protein n=1 Tax=Fagus sylvatica TaxID=28930 RepID=A0A2N9GSS7_FAGSY
MPQRDVVSWTVLIMGYKNSGKYDHALIAFKQMQYAGVVSNCVTMVNALAVCASFGALEMGVWIHDFIKRKGLGVFRSMKEKNVFTWNVLIKGLALAKSGEEAICWFNRMELEGFKADEVTLVGVLCACSHSGLMITGRRIFGSVIVGKYGFSPSVKHFACMIDLFARAGYLEDAFKFIREMPFEPTKAMWGSLLAGSRARGNLEFSEFAAWKLVKLDPENCAYYVVLSNLYAEMGRWIDVEKVRIMMKERGLKKDLGCSSIELEPQEHVYELLLPH